MRKFLFGLFLCLGVVLTSCTTDETPIFGDVYGIISDTKSGSPIRNAEITISPGNSTTVSGSDGHFEFKSLEAGQYKISVTADGYSSNSRQVTIVAGQSVSCDIHLTPQNNDVVMITPTSLDFGVNELQLATTITNESDSETEWFLDLGDTPWLYAYPTTGRIGGGKHHTVVFTANRARMKEDKSSIVKVSAFGDDTPLSIKCKQSVQLSSVMVVESLNVDFGEEATEQIIRIHNISETDVNWTLWGNDSGYLTMSATHGIVAPGGSQIVTISLNREELNEVLATTFKISDGTVDQPVNVIAYPTPEGATTTNKIFYTSTDGNIVEPNDPSAFGANIVSNTYEYGQGVITFDGDVTAVGKFAFQDCENLQSTHLPDGVTTIGESAFYNCGNLVSLNVPNGVTLIERVAFYRCNNLISIILPESVTYIGGAAFAYCSSLTSINIPDSVTSIGNTTFYDCSSLTSIDIPDGVTSIGNSAFSGCSGLTSVNLGSGVTSIGEWAFCGCSGLTSIDLPNGITSIGKSAFFGCSSLTSIDIPDGVTSIMDAAFSGCSGLTSITIPDSVTSIGSEAFRSCTGLTSIDIPKGVTSIGESAFYNCSGLTSIDLPNGITSIESYTFCNCSGLTSITIPDAVTSIGSGAFEGCSGLTSITIPDGVTSIEMGAFYNCSGLTSINIPDGVTSIRSSTFRSCSNLTSITIGTGLTSIGDYAFYECSNLASVYCKPTTPPTSGFYVFDRNATDRKIYVPSTSADAYKAAEGWSSYADAIVGYEF